MDIRKLTVNTADPAALDSALAAIAPEPVACCNWPDNYPYTPEVSFRAFHTGDFLVVRFDVREEVTAALVTEDNGRVWTDSCVELFIAPDEKGYYNFETTCIGCMLLGYNTPGHGPEHATADILAGIRRIGSLPPVPFAERMGDNRWSMTIVIPPSALFRHELESWDGADLRVNLYKCGDELSKPHFLSWKAIDNPSPNFHLPRFFGRFRLEE